MKKYWVKIITALIVAFCVFFVAVMVKAYIDGQFDSVETMQAYIEGYGIWGPVILTVIQALQVIVPVLPGFLGCAVGAVLFGPVVGFACNYIGISVGSIVAFLLAKRFGKPLVDKVFKVEKYKKWTDWAGRSKSYTVFLFLAMVLPLFPDDFFCYFTGLTEMSTKKFVIIIALGKPWCILAYSLGFSLIG